MDLPLADPDPLGAEMPAEREPVDPDGVCESLGWGELLGGDNALLGLNPRPILELEKPS